MALPTVTTRRVVISVMHACGWDGPVKGRSRETFMTKGKRKVAIPNEHRADIVKSDLKRILRKAGISEEEWDEHA